MGGPGPDQALAPRGIGLAKVFHGGEGLELPSTGLGPLGGPGTWAEGPAKLLLPPGVPNVLQEPDGLGIDATLSSLSIVMSP